MTQEEIEKLADEIVSRQKEHVCRFDDQATNTIYRLADKLQNGGMANFEAVLSFGQNLRDARKAGVIAITGAIVLGVAGLIWSKLTQ